MKNIVAIIVSYYPERTKLANLVKALENQVEHIIVVDNGTPGSLIEELEQDLGCRGVRWKLLRDNKGVATAHNEGIREARLLGADHVILFDHDSLPGPNMVAQLVSVSREKKRKGVKVAAVGPNYFDERQNNPPPFIEIRGLMLHRNSCIDPEGVVRADYLISSGCLIPMDALNVVGEMNDELFIDFIDIEWGLRARANGYQCFGVFSAEMKHDLGDKPVVFMGKAYPARSPLRHYYHFRNALWLYKQRWVPWNWKVVDCGKLLLKFGFYSLITQPQAEHFRMMLLGLWHGFIGRMGKLG